MQDEIYEPDSLKILSRHNNLIGFKFEVAHLRGALRAASNSEAESTEIKLAIKSKAYGAEVQGTPQKPFLCLTSKGMSSNMTHEIPIGLPLTAPGGVLNTIFLFRLLQTHGQTRFWSIQALPLPAILLTFTLLTREKTAKIRPHIQCPSKVRVAELDELWEQRECAQLCPYYLDIQGEQMRLQV